MIMEIFYENSQGLTKRNISPDLDTLGLYVPLLVLLNDTVYIEYLVFPGAVLQGTPPPVDPGHAMETVKGENLLTSLLDNAYIYFFFHCLYFGVNKRVFAVLPSAPNLINSFQQAGLYRK